MHYNHHFIWDILKNKELDELYISIGVRDFAISMIGIFTPIYLLNIGFDLTEVILFHILMSVVTIISSLFIVPMVITKFGVKHSMIMSVPVTILFYLTLYNLENYHQLFYFASGLGGLALTLFFLGYHVHFANHSNKSTRGEAISVSYFFRVLFLIVGPLIGSFVLNFAGFKPLFVIVCLLFFVSGLPLLKTKDTKKKIRFSFKQIITDQRLKYGIGFFSFGADLALWLVWSIFIYNSILRGYTGLGLASSLVALFMLISTLFIGKLSDLYRNNLLRVGGVFSSAIWFFKSYASSVLQVNLLSSVYGIVSGFVAIPFTALGYDEALDGDVLEFTIFREIMIHLGKIIIFILLLFINDLQSTLLIGAITSLFYLIF